MLQPTLEPDSTQHIEDGYQRGIITGAAYDTVNHRLLIRKLYDITEDSQLCSVIQNMLSSRIFYVELNNDRSITQRNQKNGLPQGNSPLSFTEVEHTIEEALDELTIYYRSNSLRANPDKTQVMSFHLKNREAKRTLEVKWNNTDLENTPHLKYLGVTLDRTLSYKQHIHNTKKKVAAQNNLMKKLSNSKWGCNTSTIRTTALALSYECPVWARSPHASKLDPELNDACRSITGCLRPTNIEELNLLAGIAPPDIRRDVCARVEKKKQETKAAHSLHGKVPAKRRLKRESFRSSVRPADFPVKVIRCSEWQDRQNLASHNCAVNLD